MRRRLNRVWKRLSASRVAARCGAVVLLIAVGVPALFSCRSRPAGNRISHVVLISIDTCRSDYLGCYGRRDADTPNIDAIAGQGCLFETVVSPTPLTLPAHSSMMTGTVPPYHGVRDNSDYRLRASIDTLAEVLKREGFSTAAVISAFVLDSRFGLDQGFDEYHDQFLEEHKIGNISERKGGEATDVALEWLAKHKNERSFLFLHYFDPHFPYAPPPPYDQRFLADPYAGEIAFVDACIGRVVQRLKDLGIYESSLIVVVGDHGEMLGEHGESQHGYFVYESAVKVPLIIKAPGRGAARISDVVGLIDVVPTICALLGIPQSPQTQGEDLSHYLEQTAQSDPIRAIYTESRTPTKYGANPLIALVTKRWKYVQTTRPELYDLVNDPHETKNLAEREVEVVSDLRARLLSFVAEHGRANDPDNALQMDAQARRRLESLGYVAGPAPRSASQFDASKEDPKDLIAFHEKRSRLSMLLAQEKYPEAARICDQLLQMRPEHPEPYIARASIALKLRRFAEAIPLLRRALALAPQHAVGNNMLGTVFVAMRQPDQAVECFRRVLERDPATLSPPDLLAAHHGLAGALMSRGGLEQAIGHYRTALQFDPDLARAHGVLGRALLMHGKVDEAVDHYQKSLAIKPDQPDVHNSLGAALSRVGRAADALEHYREALRLRKGWLEPMNGAAWILATHPSPGLRAPAEAVELAEQASELLLQGQFPAGVAATILDTLAAAYASAGRFERAISAAEEALSLANAAGMSAEGIRQRLALYRQATPFRADTR